MPLVARGDVPSKRGSFFSFADEAKCPTGVVENAVDGAHHARDARVHAVARTSIVRR